MSSVAAASSLRSDAGYLTFLESLSRAPGEYYTTQFLPPPPAEECARASCTQFHVGAREVALGGQLGDSTRTRLRACQHRPQTELFSVAPFTLTGRGELLYTDDSSALRVGEVVPKRGARAVLQETTWHRPNCAGGAAPKDPFQSRAGALTRMDPEFATLR